MAISTGLRRALQRLLTLFVIALLAFVPRSWAEACTAFFMAGDNGPIVAKNYDWYPRYGQGALFVNKRHVVKRARLFSGSVPATWMSRYGSVTFNPMGREFPAGGINEAGLVVEILVLSETVYSPVDPRRVAINESQFAQYILDTASSLPEAIRQAAHPRIEPALGGFHFFVCDARGTCAVLEYLNGQLVVFAGDTLPVPALANATYERSIRYLTASDEGDLDYIRSLRRFYNVFNALSRSETVNDVSRAFRILSGVETLMPLEVTQWTLAYEPASRRVHFKTRNAQTVKSFSLIGMDFSCRNPVLMLDLDQAQGGDVTTRFMRYTSQANMALVQRNRGLLPDPILTAAAEYPSKMTRCLE